MRGCLKFLNFHSHLKNLDVAAVESRLSDEAALTAGPYDQVNVGLVGAGLHRKPREGRVGARPATCLFNYASDVFAAFFRQVGHHDGTEDNGRDTGPSVSKMDPEPVGGVASIDWRRHAAGDKSGSKFETGVPKSLFKVRVARDIDFWFDVSKDGRFLIPTVVGGASNNVPMTVVLNWQAGLKK